MTNGKLAWLGVFLALGLATLAIAAEKKPKPGQGATDWLTSLHDAEQQAKKLGDVLVAVVARDATVRRRKGRDPIVSEEERRKVLSAIRYVDVAMLGSESNIYDTLEKVSPDIVALGYDQYHREEEIAREAERRGIRLSVVRLRSPNPALKTSKILAQL